MREKNKEECDGEETLSESVKEGYKIDECEKRRREKIEGERN